MGQHLVRFPDPPYSVSWGARLDSTYPCQSVSALLSKDLIGRAFKGSGQQGFQRIWSAERCRFRFLAQLPSPCFQLFWISTLYWGHFKTRRSKAVSRFTHRLQILNSTVCRPKRLPQLCLEVLNLQVPFTRFRLATNLTSLSSFYM